MLRGKARCLIDAECTEQAILACWTLEVTMDAHRPSVDATSEVFY